MDPGDLARAHLRLRLRILGRGLGHAAARRSALNAELAQPELSHLAITEQHAHVLLGRVARFGERGPAWAGEVGADGGQRLEEQRLRISAQAAGTTLPLDALARRGLGPLVLDALLLVVAPDVEPAFGGLYAYVHDAVQARRATPELCVAVLAHDEASWSTVVAATGPYGALRRQGLVDAHQAERPLATPLTAAAGVIELLTGTAVDAALLGRPRRAAPPSATLPATVDVEAVGALADALGGGRLGVVGIWGAPGTGRDDVAAAVAGDLPVVRSDEVATLVAALQAAAADDSACLVEVPEEEADRTAIAELVALSRARVVLVGERPLRSNTLVTRRHYAELRIDPGRFREHWHAWATAFPHLEGEQLDDLAVRYRLPPGDVQAVAALDRSAQAWSRNGHRPELAELAGLVTRRRSSRLAAIRTPRRGPDELVLPPAELAQVLEVASSFRAWPLVAERWSLERFGNPGVTALFAGEPGTGKTLAAEVIAARGRPGPHDCRPLPAGVEVDRRDREEPRRRLR